MGQKAPLLPESNFASRATLRRYLRHNIESLFERYRSVDAIIQSIEKPAWPGWYESEIFLEELIRVLNRLPSEDRRFLPILNWISFRTTFVPNHQFLERVFQRFLFQDRFRKQTHLKEMLRSHNYPTMTDLVESLAKLGPNATPQSVAKVIADAYQRLDEFHNTRGLRSRFTRQVSRMAMEDSVRQEVLKLRGIPRRVLEAWARIRQPKRDCIEGVLDIPPMNQLSIN